MLFLNKRIFLLISRDLEVNSALLCLENVKLPRENKICRLLET